MAASQKDPSAQDRHLRNFSRDDLNHRNSTPTTVTPAVSSTNANDAPSVTTTLPAAVDHAPSIGGASNPSKMTLNTASTTTTSDATTTTNPLPSTSTNDTLHTPHNQQPTIGTLPADRRVSSFTNMGMLKNRNRELVAGVKRTWKDMARSTRGATTKAVNARIIHNQKVTELVARIVYQTSNNVQLHAAFTEFKTRREQQLQQIKNKRDNLNQAKLHLLTVVSPNTRLQAQVKQESILDEDEVEAEELDLAVLQLQPVEGLEELTRWIHQIVRSDANIEEILEAVDQIELLQPATG